MKKEWKSLKNKVPEVGKLYDITNDNPFENEILNTHCSVKCAYINSNELTVAFLSDGEVFVISNDELANWWFCETEEKVDDQVYRPRHYTADVGFECIECMQMILTREQYVGFLFGNVFKYIWRHKLKGNPKEDLEKADWYLHRAIELGGCVENTALLRDKLDSLRNQLKDK